MTPKIFELVASDQACKDVLGENPIRFWPYNLSPHGVKTPYAVWQNIGGRAGDVLSCIPDFDSFIIQIDVYADTLKDAEKAAKVLRSVFEKKSYIYRYGQQVVDFESKRFRISFDISFIQHRR